MAEISKATDEVVNAAAFYLEGEWKAEAVVDTGFMRNSGYVVTAVGESDRGEAEAQALAVAERPLAKQPFRTSDKSQAMFHVAAEYTVHVEARQGTMNAALERLKAAMGAVIQTVRLR